jgi:hypothetical protein
MDWIVWTRAGGDRDNDKICRDTDVFNPYSFTGPHHKAADRSCPAFSKAITHDEDKMSEVELTGIGPLRRYTLVEAGA